MPFEFTINIYPQFIEALQQQGFSFQPFDKFLEKPKEKIAILRHDVDQVPYNSLKTAQKENELGITGSYYFRTVPQSFDEKIIKEIYSLGHEVGYHYEDVSLMAERQKIKVKRQKWVGSERTTHDSRRTEKELAEIAIESFKANLEKLRQIVPVKTICMHGSPMSRWDGRLLWKYYDYKDFGIVGEPYFDINFDEVLYLTDTGRRWDGGAVSVRDKGLGIRNEGLGEDTFEGWKVKPVLGSLMHMTPESIDFQNKFKFGSTQDIIKAAEKGELPDKMMMTFHPQRWTDKPIPWVKELVWQNVKNLGKYFLVKLRE
jgi:hypothetical protein